MSNVALLWFFFGDLINLFSYFKQNVIKVKKKIIYQSSTEFVDSCADLWIFAFAGLQHASNTHLMQNRTLYGAILKEAIHLIHTPDTFCKYTHYTGNIISKLVLPERIS